ncbi:MAG: zinc ribbon domain-containing protein [Chloroflexia bacterium]
MPLYEYWCPECKKTFEKLRPMESKHSDVKCVRCGSPVKKMLSVFAAVGRSSEAEGYFTGGGGGCACGGNCSCQSRH